MTLISKFLFCVHSIKDYCIISCVIFTKNFYFCNISLLFLRIIFVLCYYHYFYDYLLYPRAVNCISTVVERDYTSSISDSRGIFSCMT